MRNSKKSEERLLHRKQGPAGKSQEEQRREMVGVGTVRFPRAPLGAGGRGMALEMGHVTWDPSTFIEMN